jgi:hypothetical protein
VPITLFAITGFGYEPLKSPPAEPLGGSVVGITPLAIFDEVITPSAILGFGITLFAITGFGYEPLKSPLAVPLGGSVVGITPLAIFDVVITPSAILGFG